MSDIILEFRGVTREFRETAEPVLLFSGLDWAFPRGQSTAIMGESGTGKSTILHLASAMDKPDAGSVWLNGRNVTVLTEKDLASLRTVELGMVFQFHFLLKEFTVLENVMLPGWLAGTARSAVRDRSRFLLEKVGLGNRLGHFPGQLSGGERQRASLARALINDPALILADEPTGNLDERNARMVQDLLYNLVRDQKKTLLLVTHDARFAAGADHCLRLAGGKLEVLVSESGEALP